MREDTLRKPQVGFDMSRAAGLLLSGVPLIWVLYVRNIDPYAVSENTCAFKGMTGYECPGCGFTRATSSFLAADFDMVLVNNAAFPVLLILWLWSTIQLLASRPLMGIKKTQLLTDMLIILVLAFGIVRNFAWWPWPL